MLKFDHEKKYQSLRQELLILPIPAPPFLQRERAVVVLDCHDFVCTLVRRSDRFRELVGFVIPCLQYGCLLASLGVFTSSVTVDRSVCCHYRTVGKFDLREFKRRRSCKFEL